MQVSKFREIHKKKDGKYKKRQKKTYFATLWRGLHRENQKHPEKTKEKQNKQTKKQKIQKSKTIDPMGHHVTRVQT